MKTEQFYTVKTLAEKLSVTPITIYRLISEGKLTAVRIRRAIRFKPSDVDAFLETVRIGPGGLKTEEKQTEEKTNEEKHERRKKRN